MTKESGMQMAVTQFRMPSLGADMEEATLVEWLVKPGDQVHRGDIIAIVDTVKAAMDVEVFTDGWIEQLLVEPGTTVAVGAPLATIAATPVAPATTEPVATTVEEPVAVAEEPAATTADEPATPPSAPAGIGQVDSPLVRRLARTEHVDVTTLHGTGPDHAITRADVQAAAAARHRLRASPLARKKAADLGVDLATVVGSGPEGAVTEADVLTAASAGHPPAPTKPEPKRTSAGKRAPTADRATAMQQATAALMARSKREIPHFYLNVDIDLHTAMTWLERVNAGRPVEQRLVAAALLLKAAALAAKQVPDVNGFWLDDQFAPAEHVHLGVAVSMRQGGLIAPAIHDADTLAIDELMSKLRDVVARARAGRLRRSEMADPTITVTNLGELGVTSVFGVIYPPQVAVVGFGRVTQRPWAAGDAVAARPVVTATMSADHRALDGHRAGRYLTRLAELLEKPAEL